MTVTIGDAKFRSKANGSDWANLLRENVNGFAPSALAGIDSSDNCYYWGLNSSSTNFIASKINSADGSLAWSKSIPASNQTFGWAGYSDCDAAGGYTAAIFSGVDTPNNLTYFNIILLDSSGSVLFSKTYSASGSTNRYGKICVDSSGNVYVLSKAFASNAGSLVKFNSSGTLVWSNNITPSNAYSFNIKLDSNNNIAVAYTITTINNYRVYFNTINPTTGQISGTVYSVSMNSGYNIYNIDFSLSSSLSANSYVLLWGTVSDTIYYTSFIACLQIDIDEIMTANYSYKGLFSFSVASDISAVYISGSSGSFLIFSGPRQGGPSSTLYNTLTILNSAGIGTDYNRRLFFQTPYGNIPGGCCAIGSAGSPMLIYSSNGGLIVSYNITRDYSSKNTRITMRLNDNKYAINNSTPPFFELRETNLTIASTTIPMLFYDPASAFSFMAGATTNTLSISSIGFLLYSTSFSFGSYTPSVTDYSASMLSDTIVYRYY